MLVTTKIEGDRLISTGSLNTGLTVLSIQTCKLYLGKALCRKLKSALAY